MHKKYVCSYVPTSTIQWVRVRVPITPLHGMRPSTEQIEETIQTTLSVLKPFWPISMNYSIPYNLYYIRTVRDHHLSFCSYRLFVTSLRLFIATYLVFFFFFFFLSFFLLHAPFTLHAVCSICCFGAFRCCVRLFYYMKRKKEGLGRERE